MVAAAEDEVDAIMKDESIPYMERVRRRQKILNDRALKALESDEEPEAPCTKDLTHLSCGICLELCDRPVSAPCQHNFCLSCFRRWCNQGKQHCPSCRAALSAGFIRNPRVNTILTSRIREVLKPAAQRTAGASERPSAATSERPDQAFMSENAKRKGLSNASSGRIFVTCCAHHFGPILADHDPERSQGVLVGECWQNRLHCRQWGAHMPHVAGIAGQSGVGAQSVVLSGGYTDDHDEGEWFLYTGSGGRDLSGNKRTNKEQSFDQQFESSNKALLRSCEEGLPVRVVRSHKEKRSPYAPADAEWGLRYDGVYRILACWRSAGEQGCKVCRYLFRRCDNEAAPWSSGQGGDGPLEAALPEMVSKEIGKCEEKVHYPKPKPSWAYDDASKQWVWKRAAPRVTSSGPKAAGSRTPLEQLAHEVAAAYRSLRKFGCELCSKVLDEPVCAPCGHLFCKSCICKHYQVQSPSKPSARSLRARKQRKQCPVCQHDLCAFMDTCQVNRALAEEILQHHAAVKEAKEKLEDSMQQFRQEIPKLRKLGEEDTAPAGAEAAVGWFAKVWREEEDSWAVCKVLRCKGEGNVVLATETGQICDACLTESKVEWLVAIQDKHSAVAAKLDAGNETQDADSEDTCKENCVEPSAQQLLSDLADPGVEQAEPAAGDKGAMKKRGRLGRSAGEAMPGKKLRGGTASADGTKDGKGGAVHSIDAGEQTGVAAAGGKHGASEGPTATASIPSSSKGPGKGPPEATEGTNPKRRTRRLSRIHLRVE